MYFEPRCVKQRERCRERIVRPCHDAELTMYAGGLSINDVVVLWLGRQGSDARDGPYSEQISGPRFSRFDLSRWTAKARDWGFGEILKQSYAHLLSRVRGAKWRAFAVLTRGPSNCDTSRMHLAPNLWMLVRRLGIAPLPVTLHSPADLK